MTQTIPVVTAPLQYVTDMSSAYKKALVNAAQLVCEADTDVGVYYGAPGTTADVPNDVISVGRVTAEITQPTMSATNRSRECVMEAIVTVSVFRPGDQSAEQIAGDRAYELLNRLEEYVRVTDITLGGLVRHCMCTYHESTGITDDPLFMAEGRAIAIAATFTAAARISNSQYTN